MSHLHEYRYVILISSMTNDETILSVSSYLAEDTFASKDDRIMPGIVRVRNYGEGISPWRWISKYDIYL
jgi:hypothetical protein